MACSRPVLSRSFPILALTLLAVVGDASARKSPETGSAKETPRQPVAAWLVAGPQPHPLAAFAEEKPGGVGVADLLDEPMLASVRLRPREGQASGWFGGASMTWSRMAADKKGLLRLDAPSGDGPAVAWLAAYLAVERYAELELIVEGSQARRAWLDGQPVASGGKGGGEDEQVKGELALTPGKHVLLLQTVRDPGREGPWTVGAALGKAEGIAVEVGLDPRRDLEIRDVLDAPRVTSLAVSPDGARVAMTVARIVPGTHDEESWVEIRRTSDGTPEQTWRGAAAARQVEWSPDGRWVSFVARAAAGGDQASTLFLSDRESGSVVPLLESVERLGGYRWSPAADAIVYSTTRKAEKDERGVKRVEGLMDRWAGYRDKQFLYLVTVPDGNRRRLTAGALATDAVDFSPDGKRLLFTRRVERLEQRPFAVTELWQLDLERFETRKLRDFRWFNDAAFDAEGRRLLVAASADEFDGAGRALEQDRIVNSYDGQLFIWDPATDEVDPITREFDPAVTRSVWSWRDGRIYLLAEERDRGPLFRYDPATRAFERIDTGFDANGSLDLPRRGPRGALLGSSPWAPERLVTFDLERGEARTLVDPAGDWFADVRTGRVEPWSFRAGSGKTIDGRIYYPPAFDGARRYPAIVYYYGGTSPVGREFGGRYPKEWWAANGYVVYVLQPSGATGFGQSHAAAHVNDWGETTAQEIVDGTRAFLEAHPFVDPARVGCIGASYGGFMTMLLTTRTDLFAAAVSHAGISSLASYWGEGYWGALYSAVATADSFPWNRRDIYVDRSPLFRADQNRVPILLTHGAADTNVPVGESDAFFIALKLLGKEVEYLQVEGQDHWIVDHAKRLVWSRSIVAWFDRRLKGQPEWWDALYPGADTQGQGAGAGD